MDSGFSEDVSLLTCRDCSLSFISPQMDSKELSEYYPADYYPYRSRNTWKEKVFRLLAGFIYSDGIKNRTVFRKIFFSILRPCLRGAKIVSAGRVLDAGYGSGLFLSLMKSFGMQCYGIEPYGSPDVLIQEPEIHLYHQDLETAGFPDEFFDVVTINHVLEHVHDPLQLLKEVGRILRKDGSIIIGVPNSKGLLNAIFGPYSVLFDVPRHLFHFSFEVLDKYAEFLGFKVVEKRFIWDIYPFIESVRRIFKRERISKELRLPSRGSLLISPFVLFLEACLGLFGRGSFIEVEWKK